ncbi:Rv0361 family membrane protein [Nocardia paucivorans]|uniref:Rv0361 family membrane protein n=1 Tax=Nocardia paucivorans TaxID=114259 RepID=UPI0002E9A410|nr:hypothetical protein [Nocardia paucivorans]
MSHPNDDKNPKRASTDREPSTPDDQRRVPSTEQESAIDTPESAAEKPDTDTSPSDRVSGRTEGETPVPPTAGTANDDTASAPTPEPKSSDDVDTEPSAGSDESHDAADGHAGETGPGTETGSETSTETEAEREGRSATETGSVAPGVGDDTEAREQGGDVGVVQDAETGSRTGKSAPESEERPASGDSADSDGPDSSASPAAEKSDSDDPVTDGEPKAEPGPVTDTSDTETAGENGIETSDAEKKPDTAERGSTGGNEQDGTAATPTAEETTEPTEDATTTKATEDGPDVETAPSSDTPENEDAAEASESTRAISAPVESGTQTAVAAEPEKTSATAGPDEKTPAAPPAQVADETPTERVDLAEVAKAGNRRAGDQGTAADKARSSGTAPDPVHPAATGPDAKTERISLAQGPGGVAPGRSPENSPTERINMADLKKTAPKPGRQQPAGAPRPADTSGRGDAGPDAKTVKIPAPQPSDDQPTTALPTQKPENSPTERINLADLKKSAPPAAKAPDGTDRVDASTRRPLAKPPSTPRSATGPKQPGAQGPDQRGPRPGGGQPPARQPAPPRPVGGAPSPADTKRTVADRRVEAPGLAAPQRVEPATTPAAPGQPKRWLIAVGVAAALVLVLIVVAVLVGSGDNSPQAQIRAAIGDYTRALTNGDLAALQTSTCGALHEYYQGMSEEQFEGVHRQAKDEGSLPVVTGVDAIQITGDTALAQATVKGENGQEDSARTFDLQRTEDGWKVCEPAGATR